MAKTSRIYDEFFSSKGLSQPRSDCPGLNNYYTTVGRNNCIIPEVLIFIFRLTAS